MLRRTIDELMSRIQIQQQWQQQGVDSVSQGVDSVSGRLSAMAAAGHDDEAMSVEEGSLWDALSLLVTARDAAKASGGDRDSRVLEFEGGRDVVGGGGSLDYVQGGCQLWVQPRHRARLLAATLEALKLLQVGGVDRRCN